MKKNNKIFVSYISLMLSILICIFMLFSVEVKEKQEEIIDSPFMNDTLVDGGGRKAKVIILAGQSNASGHSYAEYLKKNVSAEKYAEYEAGYDNVYINNYSTVYTQSKGFIKCKIGLGELEGRFGPELGIADKLHKMYPNDLFFIIKFAWGATSLFEHWLSPSSGGTLGTLYNGFIDYVEASLQHLKSKNYDIEIVGMCWMQGESDYVDIARASKYELYLNNFISDIRLKFNDYSADRGIVFVDAYIAEIIFWEYFDIINQAKQNVADSSEINIAIDVNEYGFTTLYEPYDNPDIAHFDSIYELQLGELFATALSTFFN